MVAGLSAMRVELALPALQGFGAHIALAPLLATCIIATQDTPPMWIPGWKLPPFSTISFLVLAP